MMVNFTIPCKIIDDNGDVTWTELKIQPSDYAGDNWLDLSFVDAVVVPENGNMMIEDPAEFAHAIKLAAEERERFLAEDGQKVYEGA